MNELLAKLTNLGYELFSVIIPGFVLALFAVLWWRALGPLAPLWTGSAIPELTAVTARNIADSLNAPTGAGVGIVALSICYFSGHILLWIARAGGPADPPWLQGWRRVLRSLGFQIPKPKQHFNSALQKLYEKVQARFSVDGAILNWREFYPVVKVFVAERLKTSLIPTYQNKYTFHRSVAAAGALLFWVCVASAIAACMSTPAVEISIYVFLSALALAALAIVWGFSASYLYHWEMFGNTVITEAYSYIFGPKEESNKDEGKKG